MVNYLILSEYGEFYQQELSTEDAKLLQRVGYTIFKVGGDDIFLYIDEDGEYDSVDILPEDWLEEHKNFKEG